MEVVISADYDKMSKALQFIQYRNNKDISPV